jgi:D-tyrosyl-tRNA(Tyr) deacylase
MRICLQRVRSASVAVDGETVARIGAGLVLLVGISHGDNDDDAGHLAEKCVNLRIFEDEHGKMNRSARDTAADILAISQFTLYASTARGRRPSFTEAAPGEVSRPLFEKFVDELHRSGLRIKTGVFGAHMQVSLINDGPVTIFLQSRKGT